MTADTTGTNQWDDRFDEELALGMLRRSQAPEGGEDGVPGYLGIRFTEVGPGFCVAELMVGDHLLNPFGAAHGAVLAGLVDHVLGATAVVMVECDNDGRPVGTALGTLALTPPKPLEGT